jgi:DNA-binding transcriptional regulator YhcF (GntR family)
VKISINQDGEVPLHEQISEQIVFQITTGTLRTGEEMPSVRALAQRLQIHHNTVSKAYATLVKRKWLNRRRGARLHVGANIARSNDNLDSLIDKTIQQARAIGFSIKQLEERVIERLSMEAPRYVLVVEEEVGLRRIVEKEIRQSLNSRVESCSPSRLARFPDIATDAIVVGSENVIGSLDRHQFKARLWTPLIFNSADEHLDAIRLMKNAGTIAVTSYSPAFLKTARGLIKGNMGEMHSYREFLFPIDERPDFRAMDLVFCDSLTMEQLKCRNKRHYRLVAPEVFALLREWLIDPRLVDRKVQRERKKSIRLPGRAPC